MPAITHHELVSFARGRRRSLGLSQEDVARQAGISRRALYSFEHGAQTGIGTVLRILDSLGLGFQVGELRDPGASRRATDLDALLEERRR